jgi:hypothetical protein
MKTDGFNLQGIVNGWTLVATAHARAKAAHCAREWLAEVECLSNSWPKIREALAADIEEAFTVPDAISEMTASEMEGLALTTTVLTLETTVPLSVADPKKATGIPEGWMTPVAAFFEAILQKAEDQDIRDSVLLDTVEAAARDLPSLLDSMDVQGLADLFERSMGQAAVSDVVRNADLLTARADKTQTFSVDGPEISFAPMAEAIAKLDRKTPVAAALSSEDWARVPLALRERGQFSAHVESVRFLSTVQDKLMKSVSLQRERVAYGETFVDRDSFIRDMRRIAEEEGIQTTDQAGRGTIRDIHSVGRLGLIYDQQTQSAAEFTRWKMGQDPDVLNEFPAWRFVRVSDVEKARVEHIPFEGEVRLKTDLDFWMSINEDFGVPWGPWGYGCGHDVEEVDRDEAEALGLIAPGQMLEPVEKDFNDRLEASVQDWRPDEVSTLEQAFGDQVVQDGGKLQWQGNLISDFYDNAVAQPQGRANLDLGMATGRAINMAARRSADINGYTLQMKADDVRHALKKHGTGSPDRNPIDRLDLELVPHVWRDPDEVTRGADGALLFKKTVDGRLVFVEFERSEKNKLAGIKTIRREV